MFKESNELIIRDRGSTSQCWDRTYGSLRNLFLNSACSQEEYKKIFKSVDKLAWLKEFCTIHVRGPRRCGHTSALLNLIKNYHLSGIIFLPTHSQCEMTKRSYKEQMSGNIIFCPFSNIDQVRGLKEQQFIAIEICSLCGNKKLSEIYDLCCALLIGDPVFVILIQ